MFVCATQGWLCVSMLISGKCLFCGEFSSCFSACTNGLTLHNIVRLSPRYWVANESECRITQVQLPVLSFLLQRSRRGQRVTTHGGTKPLPSVHMQPHFLPDNEDLPLVTTRHWLLKILRNILRKMVILCSCWKKMIQINLSRRCLTYLILV